MKTIKRILGIVLMLAGILAVLTGALSAVVECINIYKWGCDAVEIAVLAVLLLICAAGAWIFRSGKRVFSGKKIFQKKRVPVESIVTKEQDEGKKEETVPRDTERVQKASFSERYTLLVEDVFTVLPAGCVVSGILKGGTMSLHDGVWLLHADGSAQTASVERMEAFREEKAGKVISAQGETRLGILLKGAVESDISPGCVLSNVAPNTDDVGRPIENPRLKGLLAGRGDTLLEGIDELIRREIQENAGFLAVVVMDTLPEDNGDGTAVFQQKSTMTFPFLTSPDEKHYQPVFTDWTQLQPWENENGKTPDTILMSQSDFAALVLQNDILQGAVINPFTDNLILEKSWFR